MVAKCMSTFKKNIKSTDLVLTDGMRPCTATERLKVIDLSFTSFVSLNSFLFLFFFFTSVGAAVRRG